MCGRYSLQLSQNEVRGALEKHNIRVENVIGASNAQQSTNIAPQSYGAIYRGDNTLEYMRWGLQPSFAKKKIEFSSFNTRAESLKKLKPVWSCAKDRRGVVVMDGYYEWQHIDGQKLPWFIKRKNGEPLLVLVIWDRNRYLGPEALDTFSIVTTEASSTLRHIHPRMPVAIDYQSADDWINGDWPDVLKIITSMDSLMCYRVGTEVNKIGNHSASLNKPLRQSKKLTDFFGKPETLGPLRQKSEPVDDCRIKSDSHTADKSGIPTDKLTVKNEEWVNSPEKISPGITTNATDTDKYHGKHENDEDLANPSNKKFKKEK